MRHLNCPPAAQTVGFYISAVFNHMKTAETAPIMEKYGLLNIAPDQWFATHIITDSLNELAQNPNISENLVAIGMKIGMMIPTPPDMKDPDLEKMLMGWNASYQSIHRNADVGGIQINKVNDKHYVTTHTDIFPDDMSYGIVYAFAQRFLPPGTRFKVYYDPAVTARDYGGKGDKTIIHVEWP